MRVKCVFILSFYSTYFHFTNSKINIPINLMVEEIKTEFNTAMYKSK